ncbi:MAG: Uma2 family endonuclease [Cytophagales bacterium]|nr:Uma2 family endonuclease [Cytophagales bacterium]
METISIQTESANLTEEQFFLLCSENKEIRFERDKHQNIIIMAPTGSLTSSGHSGINAQLWYWNKRTKSGQVFDSSAGFTLPNGAMRAPDAAWIANERWEKIPLEDKKRFAHICPDFVIEVLSETDSLKQQKEKMQEWIENGCRLGWLIDLEHKTTYIYKPGREIIQQTFEDNLKGEDVLPEFVLKLYEII